MISLNFIDSHQIGPKRLNLRNVISLLVKLFDQTMVILVA